MAGKQSKERKKLTYGWASINDNNGRLAEDTSINGSADPVGLGSTMALDYSDIYGPSLETPKKETSESHAANDPAAESQTADRQTTGYQEPSGMQYFPDLRLFLLTCLSIRKCITF